MVLFLYLSLFFSIAVFAQDIQYEEGQIISKEQDKLSSNITDITFESDNSRQKGYIIEPKNPPANRKPPYPIIIFAHGGDGGHGKIPFVWLNDLANKGYIIAVPAFHGYNGSEGKEDYGGTKDMSDIINIVHITRKWKNADPTRLFGAGHSNGATKIYNAAERIHFDGIAIMAGECDLNKGLDGDKKLNIPSDKEYEKYYLDINGYKQADEAGRHKILSKRSICDTPAKIKTKNIKIFHGKNDTAISPAQAKMAAEKLKDFANVSLEILPGGHGLYFGSQKKYIINAIDQEFHSNDEQLKMMDTTFTTGISQTNK